MKPMKLKIACAFLLSCLAFLPTPATAERAYAWETAFEEGNRLFEQGQYEAALEQYQEALDFGFESWELYYNMGNACYRLVDYPKAILYYEKSLKLSPKEADTRNNLALAEQKTLDRFEPLPRFFLHAWWDKACGLLSLNGWAAAILAFFALGLISSSLYAHTRQYQRKKAGFFLCAAFSLLFVCSLAMGASQYKRLHTPYAIVMADTVNVKSSPEERSETKFVLHEGSKVKIEDRIGNYCKIRIKNGSRGWIPEQSMERI